MQFRAADRQQVLSETVLRRLLTSYVGRLFASRGLLHFFKLPLLTFTIKHGLMPLGKEIRRHYTACNSALGKILQTNSNYLKSKSKNQSKCSVISVNHGALGIYEYIVAEEGCTNIKKKSINHDLPNGTRANTV